MHLQLSGWRIKKKKKKRKIYKNQSHRNKIQNTDVEL